MGRKANVRVAKTQQRFNELAASRTGQEPMQEKVAMIPMHWHIHGRT